CLQHEDTPFTF
nr:immunoglobulin light chain junction region [Macaca mulatta]MOW43184.1 immunoglobulin light chain junction region [Macaca mulatta]